jgi:hypothetical protein
VVNNARFLILPWVRVPHLASMILAQAARVLPEHWQHQYLRKIAVNRGILDWPTTNHIEPKFQGFRLTTYAWSADTQTS